MEGKGPLWGLRRLINKQEIRVLVLSSLALQIILIFLAIFRKRNANKLLSLLLWFSYLAADYVATLALGYLLYKGDPELRQSINSDLTSFWAPFLLIHLGGPDTITSYSLEDNELWWRHFLGLVVQVSVTSFVLLETHHGHGLWKATVAAFVIGILKYGERTLCLRSASMDQIRDSTRVKPDPGPDYVEFMNKYHFYKEEGRSVDINTVHEPGEMVPLYDVAVSDIDTMEQIINAHYFFESLKRLIVDLMLSFRDRTTSMSFFMKQNHTQAFKMVEIELSFLYDTFHTKSIHLHSITGRLLRALSFGMTIVTLLLFIFTSKEGYKKIDVKITYALLISALGLEVLSILLLILSDWTIVSLERIKQKKIAKAVSTMLRLFLPKGKPRWSNSMNQYQLITFCLRDRPTIFKKVLKFVKLKSMWDAFWFLGHKNVPDNMKRFIFDQVKEKASSAETPTELRRLKVIRRESVEQIAHFPGIEWSTSRELDESVILWHIATYLCYHDSKYEDGSIHSSLVISKNISDYMLYLLVFQPAMMPAGIAKIRFQDTCAEAKKFFETKDPKIGKVEASLELLSVPTDIEPIIVKGDRSKSVLFNSCWLAKQLLDLNAEKRWKLISVVWVEMLGYAAANCRTYYHAKQLSSGGELLTHCWLLMVHMGIGEQYRVDKGHARAELVVE